jgi:hypothetical protein
MNPPLYPAKKQPVQINIVPIFKFIKKLIHEKFKINSIIRGNNASPDVPYAINGNMSGGSGDRRKDRPNGKGLGVAS